MRYYDSSDFSIKYHDVCDICGSDTFYPHFYEVHYLEDAPANVPVSGSHGGWQSRVRVIR